MRAAAGAHGGNPEIGNVLPGLLAQAGLCMTVGVVVKAIRPATPEWRWPDSLFRQLLPTVVDKGHVTKEVSSSFLAGWEARCQDPATVFFPSPVAEVVGRRP